MVAWLTMGDPPPNIGPYRTVRKIGEGGMGAVFEALHETIQRRVAIKVLHPEYAGSPEMATRFINEARAVNIVEHPGLVQVSDYGQLPDGTAYIVMEYLKGETLAQRLEKSGGTLSLPDVVHLAWQLADSLAAAHDKGIIHRDLKPQNIMLVRDPHMPIGERAKILDFGIAKVGTDAGGAHIKTRTNAVMGTPLYMSPEQCAGAGKVDTRSDVYSLGCILYSLLVGRPPFIADGAGLIMSMHLFQEPEPLQRLVPKIPPRVSALVHRMLAKTREDRPEMHRIAEDMDAVLKTLPPIERRIPNDPPRDPDATRRLPVSSTLGRAASQASLDGRRRWGSKYTVALLASMLVGGGAFLFVRNPHLAMGVPATSLDNAPKIISVQVTSEPSGADIVRSTDGVVLGSTPWSQRRQASAELLAVRIRRIGFEEGAAVVDLGKDTSQHIVLVAKPTLPPPAVPKEPPVLVTKPVSLPPSQMVNRTPKLIVPTPQNIEKPIARLPQGDPAKDKSASDAPILEE